MMLYFDQRFWVAESCVEVRFTRALGQCNFWAQTFTR